MKQSKITFLTSVGAGLEYYDMVIYGLLAKFISQQYFPSSSEAASLFATFGVFALSGIVRPLSGVVLGIFGDRLGRKKIFANTLLWMAFATFAMGVMPTFATIGIIATILFSICRIVQGLAFGAEMPGAMTLLLEHVDPRRHGIHFGFMIAIVTLGVLLGSFIAWVLGKILTESQIFAWGFRLPFILGGVLAVVGFYIRKHVPETPAFLALKRSKSKLTFTMIKQHLGTIFLNVGILLLTACLILFFLVCPVYLHDVFAYSFPNIYLAITCSYIWSVIILPILGWVSDRTDRRTLLILAAAAMVIFGFPVFSLLHSGTLLGLFIFVMFGQTIIAMMSVSYFVLIPQSFYTAMRFTGTGVSYNIAYILAAGIPLVANYFYVVLKKPNYVAAIFVGLSCMTIVSALLHKKLKQEDRNL